MRLARRLRLERSSDDLSLNQLAALGTLNRCGELTVGELAGIEKVKPPSMTRTVNSLDEAGLVTRRPHPTDGRQVVVDLTPAARQVLEEDRRRRDAWLAQRLGRALPRAAGALLRDVAPLLEETGEIVRSTFAALRVRNYRLFAERIARLQRRHVDAARRPGLAGARAHRQCRRTGHHDRPAVPAARVALPDRRRDRRPLLQAPSAHRHPDHARPHGGHAGPARSHRVGDDVARVRAGVPVRRRRGVRRAGPPGVRQRDGRTGPAGRTRSG